MQFLDGFHFVGVEGEVTGDVLHGSLPPAKLKSVQRWLDAHRDQVA